MADRRDLKDEMNRINELYQQKDLELRKIGGSDQQRQQMRDMLNSKKERLISEQGDSLQKLNAGMPVKIQDASVAGPKGMMDQSKLPDASKSRFSGILSKLGKKAAGVIPLAGAGYAALQGDPAMAADQLAGDIPVVGQAYEAFKPEGAGQSTEDEKVMLGEIQARKDYDNSPAGVSAEARRQALKNLGK